MKRAEQESINTMCVMAYETAMEEYGESHTDWKRLRSCTADVCETENYYILRSYNTIVAVMDKAYDMLYDVLRLVYGYTATSAQHISKFDTDYSSGSWKNAEHLVYRTI